MTPVVPDTRTASTRTASARKKEGRQASFPPIGKEGRQAAFLLNLGLIPSRLTMGVLGWDEPGGLVALAHRGAGKSVAAALKALQVISAQAGPVLYTAPTLERQGGRFLELTQRLARQSGLHLTRVNDTLRGNVPGSVQILPAKPSNIRGLHDAPLVIIDEAGMISDEVFPAVVPFLTPGDERILVLGTPSRPSGRFYELCTAPPAGWRVLEVGTEDSPHVRAEDLSFQRALLGSAYAREYGNRFEVDAADPLFCDLASLIGEPPFALTPEFGGLDFGYTCPTAAVWGRKKDGVFYVLDEFYQNRQTTNDLATQLPRRIAYYFDPAGAAEAAALRQAGFAMRPADNDRRFTISRLRELAVWNKLRISPRCKELLRELRCARVTAEFDIIGDDHAIDALRYLLSRLHM